MKSLKNLFVVATLTLASTTLSAKTIYAFGNYTVKTDARTIKTAPVDTKQAAYDTAFSTLSSLQNSSPQDLSKRLSIRSFNIKANKTHLNEDSYVTVQEQMNSSGDLEYVGLVNAKIHYIERDD